MPRVNMRTRKPVDQLMLSDFLAFPVWEYAIDEEGAEDQDETWVRPVDSKVVPKRSYTHVAVDFLTSNGKKYSGFVTVSTLNGAPEICQGVILCARDYLFVANPGSFGFKESRNQLLKALKLTEQEMFPLKFQLRIPIDGRKKCVSGVLP